MAEQAADWSARISAWQSSGKSGAAWCRDNSISYYKFQYWREKLLQSGQHKKSGQFVPLNVSSPSLRIECNGAFLHISSEFDATLLKKVISVLRAI